MDVGTQVAWLQRGPRPRDVVRPCTVGDGIVRLDAPEGERLLGRADAARLDGDVSLFVPASGAATRLVKAVSVPGAERPDDLAGVARTIWDHLPELAFWDDLVAAGEEEGVSVATLHAAGRVGPVFGLVARRLGERPKALVPFHQGARSPLEEHLRTAVALTTDRGGVARAHFTVAEAHRAAFEAAAATLAPRLLAELGARVEVGFSVQDPATDTVCVRADGRLVLDDDGRPVRRPGGHGALLANLAIGARRLLAVTNVDNVIAASHAGPLDRWRAILVGLAAELADAADAAIRDRDASAARALCERLSLPTDDPIRALDRPLRVCGMVPASGKPGGGPFWVRGGDGRVTPQIVESVELPAGTPLDSATHFNPVELVVALRGHAPTAWSEPDAVLVTSKVVRGADAVVLEHPGLWNGGMARWGTVFVELPPETSQPVKTLADLLEPAHRG